MLSGIAQLSPRSTLSELWSSLSAELAETVAPRTIAEQSSTLRHWVRITTDPALEDIDAAVLLLFRESLLSDVWTDAHGRIRRPLSPQTYLKHDRHVRQLLTVARRLQLIDSIPQLYVTRARGLAGVRAAERTRPVRPLVTAEELFRLHRSAAAVTWPRRLWRSPISAATRALLWRALLWLLWSYGLRISDAARLTWACVSSYASDIDAPGALLFRPWKLRRIGRLQCLPLTMKGLQLLQTLRAAVNPPDPDCLVFPMLTTPGRWELRRGTWRPGWRASWSAELCPLARIAPTIGPPDWVAALAADTTYRPPLTPHDLRRTCVTELNDRGRTGRRIGAWVAGHSLRGTDAVAYDKPDAAVFDAIARRERELFPPVYFGRNSNAGSCS